MILLVLERMSAALLSVKMGVGPSYAKPSSSKNPRSHVASRMAISMALLISASLLEWETVVSRLDLAMTAPDVVFR